MKTWFFQSGRWQLPLGPGVHSATDNLASEILGHLKLVLSEFSMIGKLEISHCTLVVTMFIISLLCENCADVCQGEESQFLYVSVMCKVLLACINRGDWAPVFVNKNVFAL